MTTFVVSLFLPKTISFVFDQREPKLHTPAPSRKASWWAGPGQFSILQPLQAAGPLEGEEEDTHIFFNRSNSSTSLLLQTSLARTDAVPPEWGQSGMFNQPISRARLSHLATILRYPSGTTDDGHNVSVNQLPWKPASTNFEPVKHAKGASWTIENAVHGNGGLRNAIQAAIDDEQISLDVQHVGTLGFPTDELDEEVKQEIADELEDEHDSLPVFVSDKNFDGHYRQFCKIILWPGEDINEI